MSDGVTWGTAMLATQFNHLIKSNAIKVGTMIRVDEHLVNEMQGRKCVGMVVVVGGGGRGRERGGFVGAGVRGARLPTVNALRARSGVRKEKKKHARPLSLTAPPPLLPPHRFMIVMNMEVLGDAPVVGTPVNIDTEAGKALAGVTEPSHSGAGATATVATGGAAKGAAGAAAAGAGAGKPAPRK